MGKFADEAMYNQHKEWEQEQEYHASENAKAEADIKAQEEMEMASNMSKMAEKNDRYCGDCLNLTLERKKGTITGSHLCIVLNQYRSEWQKIELCSSFKTARMVAEEIFGEIEKYGIWFERFDKRGEYQGNFIRISEAVIQELKAQHLGDVK